MLQAVECYNTVTVSLYVPLSLDESDIDLRHSLANLVAVILGCPTHSNHLWYHIFNPEELHGTYMTGFMV